MRRAYWIGPVSLAAAWAVLSGACGIDRTSDCAQPGLTIAFSPMYSASESGHVYQVPAIVPSVASSSLSWSASNPSIASIASDPVTGGVMITAKSAGTTAITAHAGTLCGTSRLTVTAATPEDWALGSAQYNGTGSCASCHGDAATNGGFKDIAHTPEQTGGYSDSDLDGIIRKGLVPDGGYYDGTLVPLRQFGLIHKFALTDAQLNGVIIYLRSLTPTPQTGTADFGGHWGGRDGGSPPWGRPDGGHRPDPGSVSDAG